jgi:Cytochrome c554 and c-prime
MTRVDIRPWAALVLSAAVIGYVGCTSSNTTSSSPASTPSPKEKTAGSGGSTDRHDGSAQEDTGKPAVNLGHPAAVLVVTGEMHSYLEPCGCTQGQVGGLLRRYDLLERLHKQNKWNTVQLDLGSLTKDPSVARGGFDQAKIKFDHAIKALKLLDYSAVALSAEDLKVGVGEALGLFLNSLGEKTKIVVANVAAPAGFEPLFRTSLVVTAGPVKIGVTSVIDPESLDMLNDPDKELLTKGLKRPGDVLPGVLADLESKSQYQVLMVQGPPKLARSLAEAYPGFDIVVATSEYIDVLKHDPDTLNSGETLLVQVGQQGKYVGVIGLYPGESERMKYQVVTLGTRFNGPAAPMKKLIQDEYRDTLRQMGVVENFPRRDYIGGVTGATYVGAERGDCKSCHPNTYARWAGTKHHDAFKSLLDDPKPNVIYDAECITCHTTGFEYTSGWTSETKTPYLKGNQCENCHGPASKHVADPDNVEYRKAMALTPEKAEKNRLCQGCHDGDNSPKFDFGTYYPKIAHKGLDDYKDPKVHRGITPGLAQSQPAGVAGETPHK